MKIKQITVIILSILFLSACDNRNDIIKIDKKTGNPMIVGKADIGIFNDSEFSDWYTLEYSAYEPDKLILDQIKLFSDSIKIELFIGTWCSDSRREVPRFIKILDTLDFNINHLTIIGLDRDKSSPAKFEKNKSIEYVPTFIFLINGEEIGRIVEYPIITLESDMLNIIMENQ